MLKRMLNKKNYIKILFCFISLLSLLVFASSGATSFISKTKAADIPSSVSLTHDDLLSIDPETATYVGG
jgi:hypothetical protein